MSPTLRTLGRRVVVTLALAGVALLALLAPIPTSGNAGRAVLMSQLEQRLPGWHLVRASESWESAFTVVAECGGRLVGFQYVPEHGLPAGDAWLRVSLEPLPVRERPSLALILRLPLEA